MYTERQLDFVWQPLVSEQSNLSVRELNTDERIRLTNSAVSSPVSNGRAVWSLDGKRIAFVQFDRVLDP